MDDLSEKRVLVVDDTKANVDVLVETLRGSCKIGVALSGENALKAVERNKPDLILLDVLMPGIDGYEVCRRLKANPETAGIPVVFVTALEEAASRETGFNVGGADFLNKPFEAAEVKACVAKHLGSSG